jgi:GH43 family beta-xylosidase
MVKITTKMNRKRYYVNEHNSIDIKKEKEAKMLYHNRNYTIIRKNTQ